MHPPDSGLSPARPTPQPTVLVTGFDAFGGDPLNPSAQLAAALDAQAVDGARIVGACLPTVFGDSAQRLAELLALHRPQLVLCTGLAGGRGALSLERIAININDARLPDNAGAQPIDTAVVPEGPAAYFSTLPIKAMRAAIASEAVPCDISQTAGTFVCNHVFYALMHALAAQGGGVRGGFMHLPWLPAQGTPSLSLEQMVRGTMAGLRCALRTTHDLRVGGGQTH